MSELENVVHEDNCQADTSTDNGRHETVLVAVMTDGSYLLKSYPQGEPAAFVTAEDAGPLREALNGELGTTSGAAVSTNGNGRHINIVPPGHEALHTKQAQP
jgi:hypothetical protein